MTIIFILAILFGVLLLSKGSDFLVDGASSIAKNIGISPLVIGLTIVAFGTSAPEFVVSVSSVLKGNSDIAVANVIGSNIVNILFILGLCSAIRPLIVKSSTVFKEIPLALASSFAILFLGFTSVFSYSNLSNLFQGTNQDFNGYLSFGQGMVLLMFFVIFMYYNFGLATQSNEENNSNSKILDISKVRSIYFIILGFLLLVLGAQVTIYGAVEMAKIFGISDRIIGLTIVALGTSLPELVTSVKATLKGENDIAIGNVVGSNIFNAFFILGTSSLFGVLNLGVGEFGDALISIGATMILFFSLFVFKKHQIGRKEGVFMMLLYFVYLSYLIVCR